MDAFYLEIVHLKQNLFPIKWFLLTLLVARFIQMKKYSNSLLCTWKTLLSQSSLIMKLNYGSSCLQSTSITNFFSALNLFYSLFTNCFCALNLLCSLFTNCFCALNLLCSLFVNSIIALNLLSSLPINSFSALILRCSLFTNSYSALILLCSLFTNCFSALNLLCSFFSLISMLKWWKFSLLPPSAFI